MRKSGLASKVWGKIVEESEDFTEEELSVMNPTSRGMGAVGKSAVVPRLVPKYASKTDEILDFGAGKGAYHAQRLLDEGYSVTAHEVGGNFDPEVHDSEALRRSYDLVYASNVLNVQPSEKALDTTIRQLRKVVKGGGALLCNLPASPRKGAYAGMPTGEGAGFVKEKLEQAFSQVAVVHGKNSVPVWLCRA